MARIARLHATAKPALAFGAGAMGKALRAYGATLHLLNVIVTNSGSIFKCAFQVVWIKLSALLHGVAPHAGKAIGLQF